MQDHGAKGLHLAQCCSAATLDVPQHRRHLAGKVTGQEPQGPVPLREPTAGFAVQVNAPQGRPHGIGSAGQQSGHQAGQDVARARCSQADTAAFVQPSGAVRADDPALGPFMTTTAPSNSAAAWAAASGSASISSRLFSSNCAISPACGVITLRPSQDRTSRAWGRRSHNAAASSTNEEDDAPEQSAAVKDVVARPSVIPGPMRTARAFLAVESSRDSAAASSTPPSAVSASPITMASGTARPRPTAALLTVAIWSFPAPARKAAMPASAAAPGTSIEPAITSTCPRSSLLPSRGCGSGMVRSTSEVIVKLIVRPRSHRARTSPVPLLVRPERRNCSATGRAYRPRLRSHRTYIP